VKWIFLAGLFVLTPILIGILRSRPDKYLPIAAFFLGLIPFLEAKFNIVASPYTWPAWQGYVKGIDVSLMDSIAIAMVMAGARLKTPLRLKLAFAFYAFALLVSTLAAAERWPPVFYVWQLARVVLVYYAVARATLANERVPLMLLTGLTAGLSIQAAATLVQRAGGTAQATGWFVHQNLLGMISHFIVYPALAAFLAGYHPKRMALCVAAGLIVAWAGGSRATIGLMVVGFILTTALSYWHKKTSRKATFAAAGMLFMLVAVPVLNAAVERRSETIRAGSSEERERMKAAARMVIADYPLGTGADRFVAVANVGGYRARADVAWTSAAAPVHNTYYLVAAEMGMLGLLAMMAFLISIFSLGFSILRRLPDGFEAEYVVGITVMILLVAAHAYVEWVTMLYVCHVLLAMNLGLLAAFRAKSASPARVPAKTQAQELAFAS
jgi:O-antigen ligase